MPPVRVGAGTASGPGSFSAGGGAARAGDSSTVAGCAGPVGFLVRRHAPAAHARTSEPNGDGASCRSRPSRLFAKNRCVIHVEPHRAAEEVVHEATADRISPDRPLGSGAARPRQHAARACAGSGAAPHQSRPPAAAEFQHPNRAREIPERRDVDLRAAQAHEPVSGQGRPGARVPPLDLRVPRRAAEVQRRAGGQVEEGKEERGEGGQKRQGRPARRPKRRLP